MEFREKQAIYLQIANYFQNNILEGEWGAEEKVPSIRQLAVELEVNPNTVLRTYNHLQDNGIIYKKRGIGYFVSPEAKKQLVNMLKKQFVEHDLPEFFKKMELIGLTLKDIEDHFNEFKKSINPEKTNNNEKDRK